MRIKTFPIGTLWNQPLPVHWLHGSVPVAHPSAPAIPSLQPSRFRPEPPKVELLDWDAALRHWDSWDDLTKRALENNVFLHPGFALSAVQHLPIARRPAFLFVWAGEAREGPGALSGVFALHIPAPGSGRVARLWCNEMMALGVPLLDRTQGEAAIDAMHRYFAYEQRHVDAILIPQVSLSGPFATLALQHASAGKLGMAVLDRRYRAVVTHHDEPEAFLQSYISAKKRKELRRQRRRLEELGALAYTSARSPEDVRAAMERFLTLEASGWKGNQSTALLSDPSTATFARSMSRYFARQGACHIDALELNGEPIVMGVVLLSGDTAFYWKTAYDEAYARLSPGVLFSIELTIKMMASGTHELINSCAVPNHPMIDHIWRERIEMGDLCIATGGATTANFGTAIAKERATRALRAFAKNAYYKLLGKHPR